MAGHKGAVASAILVGFLGILPLAQMLTKTSPDEPPVVEVTAVVPATQPAVAATAPTQEIDGLSDAVASLLRDRGSAQSVEVQDIDGQLPTAVIKLLSERGAVLTVPEPGDAP